MKVKEKKKYLTRNSSIATITRREEDSASSWCYIGYLGDDRTDLFYWDSDGRVFGLSPSGKDLMVELNEVGDALFS